MKVVIDNNVVVDALKPNPRFAGEAQEILRLASAKTIDGFATANSLTDIFYVLRKEHGADKAKEMIQKLFLMLDIVSIEPADCVTALEKPMTDFEDALIDVCAKKIGADCIVSRDEVFINTETEVEVFKSSQLLARLN
jgi:predicted nucleic acid-binding protein